MSLLRPVSSSKYSAMPGLQSIPLLDLNIKINEKEINGVHVLTREVFSQAINSWY